MNWRKHLIFIGISYGLSMMALAIFYPHQFLLFDQRYLHMMDTEVPFENTFSLTTQLFSGEISLFNRYDMVNVAYVHLSNGFYTLSNILVALTYGLFVGLSDEPAKFFHQWYSFFFFAINTLIRTLGGYLLILRFSKNPIVVGVSIIYLNLFIALPMVNNGLMVNNLFSYMPLVLYFLIRFFQEYRWFDAVCFVLILTLSVANSPLGALGYYYEVIHFVLLVCLVKVVVCDRHLMVDSVRRLRLMGARQWALLAVAVITGLFLIAPTMFLGECLVKDFYIEGSGLGATNGRLSNMFNITKYFSMTGRSYASPSQFFLGMIDFRVSNWGWTWMFIGGLTVMLSIIALIFSKDRMKWIFIGAITLIVLLNVPADQQGYLLIAHWINVLTNPFQFLIRSFHMADLLIPYLFLPLMVLGLERIYILCQSSRCASLTRYKFFYCSAALLIGVIIFKLEGELRIFMIVMAIGFGIIIVLIQYQKHCQVLVYLILGGLILFDGAALNKYVNDNLHRDRQIESRVFDHIQSKLPVILDYQNPQILPWREYYRQEFQQVKPDLYGYLNQYGQYYRFSCFFERYLRPNNLYEPRFNIYKNLPQDQEVLNYLYGNGQMISFVGSNGEPPAARWEEYNFNFSSARKINRGAWEQWEFKLPTHFPAYLATTVFSKDFFSWQLNMLGQPLSAVQGALTAPFQFDVQNMRKGYLMLSLPATAVFPKEAITLRCKHPDAIENIWRNQHDHLGFDYRAPADGMLVIHYPFNEKWKLMVDGSPAKIDQVNRYFMGFILSKGLHKVELSYWPQTPLRALIGIFIILTIVVFFGLVIFGLRQEKALDSVYE